MIENFFQGTFPFPLKIIINEDFIGHLLAFGRGLEVARLQWEEATNRKPLVIRGAGRLANQPSYVYSVLPLTTA
jgi:hypothetical protein